MLDALRGLGAKSVSDLSHRFIGWRAAQPGEVIPYETVFVEAVQPTEEQIAYAEELVRAGF